MEFSENNTLLASIDARTTLAGSNKMEILLFSLGTCETFGINVFKIREVTKTPPITKTPNMHPGVVGIISLRGNIIPVLNLISFLNIEKKEGIGQTMMVTEYSRQTQGFLVDSVDRIIRVDWERVKSPETMLTGNEGLITSVTELDDGRLVSILDVEQILVQAFGETDIPNVAPVQNEGETTVFFVDDSMVARKEIMQVLDKLGVKHYQANNGREAWDKLLAMAAQETEIPLSEKLKLILVDAEMPEMDGYVLTRNIKSDARFSGIPVVMHSSLSSEANRAMGKNVGVDDYVAKFNPTILAETMRQFLER
ncbi:MAG: chemotaxis protein [Burkholderiales bacterium]|nr:chemotaxis protein [Burkholderiales bacterium]